MVLEEASSICHHSSEPHTHSHVELFPDFSESLNDKKLCNNLQIVCQRCFIFLLVGIISRIAMNGGVGGPGHSCYLVSVLSLS